MDAIAALDQRDAQFKEQLKQIGQSIGFGNAQHILGELWDDMLVSSYGTGFSGHGRMGVTIDDNLPPIPKAEKLRRAQQSHGGYQMVPAYSVDELKDFGRAAIEYAASRA